MFLRDAVLGEGAEAESARQEEWREALRSAGILVRDGDRIEFVSVEPHPSTKWIHAVATTNEAHPKVCNGLVRPAVRPARSAAGRGGPSGGQDASATRPT